MIERNMRFYSYKTKEQALHDVEQYTRFVRLMRYRTRHDDAQNEVLWGFVTLCAEYANAREIGDENEKKKSLKRINKWCAGFESDATTLSRYWFTIDCAEGCALELGATREEVASAKYVGEQLAEQDAIRKGYINGKR